MLTLHTYRNSANNYSAKKNIQEIYTGIKITYSNSI